MVINSSVDLQETAKVTKSAPTVAEQDPLADALSNIERGPEAAVYAGSGGTGNMGNMQD